ncbi:MAG: PEP-CTERM sorting domain-containing protein [Candidatus Schekmanbacteria bacterium]|nr:PEP-CTERM sorting domain-containing protein [Candidatus Schekmanbacteria bacterium]
MKSKAIIHLVCILIVISASISSAQTISLLPSDQVVRRGEPAVFVLEMDFTDPTLGGRFDIFYNSSFLIFASFQFNPLLGDDPDFRRQPDDMSGELNGLAFGNFGGLSGTRVVGDLVFNTRATTPLTTISMADDTLMGGFYSAATYKRQLVIYSPANLTITPEPASISLFLLGAGGLLGLLRKKR